VNLKEKEKKEKKNAKDLTSCNWKADEDSLVEHTNRTWKSEKRKQNKRYVL